MEEEEVLFNNILKKLNHPSASIRERNLQNLFFKFSAEILSIQKYSTHEGLFKSLLNWFNYSGVIPCCKEVLTLLKKFSTIDSGASLLLNLGGVLFLKNLRLVSEDWMFNLIDSIIFDLLKKREELLIKNKFEEEEEDLEKNELRSEVEKIKERSELEGEIEVEVVEKYDNVKGNKDVVTLINLNPDFNGFLMKLNDDRKDIVLIGMKEILKFIVFPEFERNFFVFLFKDFIKLEKSKFISEMLDILVNINTKNLLEHSFDVSDAIFIVDSIFRNLILSLKELKLVPRLVYVFQTILEFIKERNDIRDDYFKSFGVFVKDISKVLEYHNSILHKDIMMMKFVEFVVEFLEFLFIRNVFKKGFESKESVLIVQKVLLDFVRHPRVFVVSPNLFHKALNVLLKLSSISDKFKNEIEVIKTLKNTENILNGIDNSILLVHSNEELFKKIERNEGGFELLIERYELIKSVIVSLPFIKNHQEVVDIILHNIYFISTAASTEDKKSINLKMLVTNLFFQMIVYPLTSVRLIVYHLLLDDVKSFISNFLYEEIIYILFTISIEKNGEKTRNFSVKFIIEVFKNLLDSESIDVFIPSLPLMPLMLKQNDQYSSDIVSIIEKVSNRVSESSNGEKLRIFGRLMFHKNESIRKNAVLELKKELKYEEINEENIIVDPQTSIIDKNSIVFDAFDQKKSIYSTTEKDINNFIILVMSNNKSDLDLVSSISKRFIILFGIKKYRDVILKNTEFLSFLITEIILKKGENLLNRIENYSNLCTVLYLVLKYIPKKQNEILKRKEMLISLLECSFHPNILLRRNAVIVLYILLFSFENFIFKNTEKNKELCVLSSVKDEVFNIHSACFENFCKSETFGINLKEFNCVEFKSKSSFSASITLKKFISRIRNERDEIKEDKNISLRLVVSSVLKEISLGSVDRANKSFRVLSDIFLLFPNEIVSLLIDLDILKILGEYISSSNDSKLKINRLESVLNIFSMTILSLLSNETDDNILIIRCIFENIFENFVLTKGKPSQNDILTKFKVLLFLKRFLTINSKFNTILIRKYDLLQLMEYKTAKSYEIVLVIKVLFFLTSRINDFSPKKKKKMEFLGREKCIFELEKDVMKRFGDKSFISTMIMKSELLLLSNISVLYYHNKLKFMKMISMKLLKALVLSKSDFFNVMGLQFLSNVLVSKESFYNLIQKENFPNFLSLIIEIIFLSNGNIILRERALAIINSIILLDFKEEEDVEEDESKKESKVNVMKIVFMKVVRRLYLLFEGEEEKSEFQNLVFLILYNYISISTASVDSIARKNDVSSLYNDKNLTFLFTLLTRNEVTQFNQDIIMLLCKFFIANESLSIRTHQILFYKGFLHNMQHPKASFYITIKANYLDLLLVLFNRKKQDFVLSNYSVVFELVNFYMKLYKENKTVFFLNNQKKYLKYSMKIGTVLSKVFQVTSPAVISMKEKILSQTPFCDSLMGVIYEILNEILIRSEAPGAIRPKQKGSGSGNAYKKRSYSHLYTYLVNNLRILRNFVLESERIKVALLNDHTFVSTLVGKLHDLLSELKETGGIDVFKRKKEMEEVMKKKKKKKKKKK